MLLSLDHGQPDAKVNKIKLISQELMISYRVIGQKANKG